MTHDFSDLTPPLELVRKWDNESTTAEMPEQTYLASAAARWGAEQAAERLANQCSEVVAVERARWFKAIEWALGSSEDGFEPPDEDVRRRYWWRRELAKRCKIRWDGTKWVDDEPPAPPTPQTQDLGPGVWSLTVDDLVKAVLTHPDFRRALEADS